ncbi:MAG: hypothetical protein Q4C34_07055 [Bacteroidales bacterium]|nr:hypothetical protein [Bacteroidales bacterium]
MSNLRSIILSCIAGTALVAGAATPISVNSARPTVTEDFGSMYDAATATASLTLPEGWAIERNLNAPRTIGAWSDATSQLMYSGGVSLASNAKNGTWNFGSSSDPADRAIGGLTTTVANGTRCVSLMTALTNTDDKAVDRLTLSYNIEKYRKGANAAGFAVQLYYSTDGNDWTSAGDSFRTLFDPDNETLGAEIVPISVTAVNDKVLMADIAKGETIYLAWNISVASGSTPDKAPGLAIDDIKITANYSDGLKNYLYVENATRRTPLTVWSAATDAFGTRPGIAATMSKTVNGVNYLAWEMPSVATFDVNAVAGDLELGPITVSSTADAYLCASPLGLESINDPATYTGWVDPDRPAFVASGIYMRGDMNSWAADADWEFSKEADDTYVLYDKTVSGAFKIADASWSGSCNYGSNGSNIMADTPYQLSPGTDDNISCGTYIFECKRVVLKIADGQAYLTLENNDDPTGLTSVYMVGDFNSWDYMDRSGELTLDSDDNLFKGRVSLKAGADGLSHWRIYQRLGMGGAWGASADGEGVSTSGTLVKGNTWNVAADPATYDITFDLNSGAYTLVKVASAPSTMQLDPAEVILTPTNPASVKILSLNNSLIHYNDQDFVFNDIARAMGKDAVWTKHTNLGKPLSYHWGEGDGLAEDGTPGAKMMVRSEAWSHIILQEQSSLPRTDPETFRNSVKQWIDYIREYCPNPNAVIILPVNWAYSSDWSNFSDYNHRFIDNYAAIAAELGCVVCPVASAYDNVYRTEGAEGARTWFSDDRHPTPQATYMAACMEYGIIFGEDPATITTDGTLAADVAASMRSYASQAVNGYVNAIDHTAATIRFSARIFDDFGIEMPADGDVTYTVDGGGTISPDGVFVSDGTRGTFTVTATAGSFTRTARITVADHETVVITYPAIVLNENCLEASENFDSMGSEATASLPEAWRIDRQTSSPRTLGTFGTALTATAYSGGTALPSNAKNGLWNFGADGSDDRAVGGITTGVANGTRAVNVYTHLYNDGRKPVENINLSYDIEKYRKGKNAAGFAVQLYYSVDGRNWISAGDDFRTFFEADSETAGYEIVPGETRTVSARLPVDLGSGMDLFLAWNISVATGNDAQAAPALAIDNVAFAGSLPEVPVTAHKIYVDNQTTWAATGLYAWGDSELFGAWPGQAPVDETVIDGVTYQIFGLDAESGNYHLIFNNWNNNKQLPDFDIKADRDYWFRIDDETVKEIPAAGLADITVNGSSLTFDGTTVHAPADSTIEVLNMQGMRVLATRGDSLSLDGLASGLYIVSANGTQAIKVALR